MTTLDISHKNLTTLDGQPQNDITFLYCNNNSLETINNLPTSLHLLDCRNNDLKSLPDPLPPNLSYLACSGNSKLARLPALPQSLKTLYCDEELLMNCIADIPNWSRYLLINSQSMETTRKGLLEKIRIEMDFEKTVQEYLAWKYRPPHGDDKGSAKFKETMDELCTH